MGGLGERRYILPYSVLCDPRRIGVCLGRSFVVRCDKKSSHDYGTYVFCSYIAAMVVHSSSSNIVEERASVGNYLRRDASHASLLRLPLSASGTPLKRIHTSYAFGLFSDTLKETLGFSQGSVDMVASIGEAGQWSTFIVGE